MNLMTHAFEKAGLPPRDTLFRIAIAKFLNSGGTINRARELLDDAAAQMGKNGQVAGAEGGHSSFAGLSQPTPSEGHPVCVRQDQEHTADARHPNVSGRATTGVSSGTRDASPRPHGPSPARIEAMRQNTRAIFTRKTFDGRAWGEIGAHELAGRGRDGALARVIKQYLGELSEKRRFLPLKELLTADQFDYCLKISEKLNEY